MDSIWSKYVRHHGILGTKVIFNIIQLSESCFSFFLLVSERIFIFYDLWEKKSRENVKKYLKSQGIPKEEKSGNPATGTSRVATVHQSVVLLFFQCTSDDDECHFPFSLDKLPPVGANFSCFYDPDNHNRVIWHHQTKGFLLPMLIVPGKGLFTPIESGSESEDQRIIISDQRISD